LAAGCSPGDRQFTPVAYQRADEETLIMTDDSDFDRQTAHRYFAAECFNQVWDLIDKAERTAAEDLQMIHLAHTSHWHWTQVADHTATNISIALWQTARVYAAMGDAAHAMQYAQACLELSRREDLPPFYVGYAYEALARAASIAGDRATEAEHVAEARRIAPSIDDGESRDLLLRDLDSIP
jgi:hypothetical protein